MGLKERIKDLGVLRSLSALSISMAGSGITLLTTDILPKTLAYSVLGGAVFSIPVYMLLSYTGFFSAVAKIFSKRGRQSVFIKKGRGKNLQKQIIEDIAQQVSMSEKIDFFLVSGYTMWFTEPEKAISEALRNLTQADLKRKRIRILLLDRTHDSSNDRAHKFFEREGHLVGIESPAHYFERAEEAEGNFQHLVDGAGENSYLGFFNHAPLFRLMIFDDAAFMGFYYPDKSGNIGGMMKIPNEDDYKMGYDAFAEYFNDEQKKAEG